MPAARVQVEDDEDTEDDEVDLEKDLPNSIKLLDDDGEVREEPINKGKKVKICCGGRPPGGWYGPFGGFRILMAVFAVLALIGLGMLVDCIIEADVWGVVTCIMVIFAAIFCIFAAYSHEGIAKQATALGKQNEIFAEKNERFAAQIQALGGVAQKLNQVESSYGLGLDQLEDTIRALHDLTAVTQLDTMLRCFTDADSVRGDRDQVLKGREVEDFFKSSDAMLRQAAPNFDFDRLKKEAMENGFTINAMQLLVSAVVTSGDDNPAKSEANLNLAMFSMDHEDYFEECLVSLKAALKGSKTEAEIRAILEQKVAEIDENSDRVRCRDLLDVSAMVMKA